jgi:hypothetical protein
MVKCLSEYTRVAYTMERPGGTETLLECGMDSLNGGRALSATTAYEIPR